MLTPPLPPLPAAARTGMPTSGIEPSGSRCVTSLLAWCMVYYLKELEVCTLRLYERDAMPVVLVGICKCVTATQTWGG